MLRTNPSLSEDLQVEFHVNLFNSHHLYDSFNISDTVDQAKGAPPGQLPSAINLYVALGTEPFISSFVCHVTNSAFKTVFEFHKQLLTSTSRTFLSILIMQPSKQKNFLGSVSSSLSIK